MMEKKKENSSKNSEKKKLFRGMIFILIVLSTIVYGYYNRVGLDIKIENMTTESGITLIKAIQKSDTKSGFLKNETTNETVESVQIENDNQTVQENFINLSTNRTLIENITNKTHDDSESNISKEKTKEEKKIVLKYFWSRFCRICVQLRVKEFLAQKKLLGDYPDMKLEVYEITEKENKAEMKRYGIVGVPSYVVEINETALILPGPLTKKSERRIQRFIMSKSF